jgi:NAD(P)H-nitrite reductase large subunit
MTSEHLVIVGGGPAATNAMETIRRYNETARITLICDEPPHSRMALPYWLAGQIPREQTHTGDDAYFRRLRVDVRLGTRVTKLNEQARTLELDSNETLAFDRLLLATGSVPVPLPIPGADLPDVLHLWTLAQTDAVLQAAAHHARPRVVMIGAGFIGLIVLNAMYKRGWELAVVERDSQILPRMLDNHAASIAQAWLEHKQVAVHWGVEVQAIEMDNQGQKHVRLSNGSLLPADIVIVATGVRPNVSLVADTSIEIEHGILVDHQLCTNVAGIYAAGDVAQAPIRFSNRREVHAIQPTAVDHGRVAGANLAGQEIQYPGSLSMNVLDICGLQSASFGDWNNAQSESFVIANPHESIYRCLKWTDDRITGAIFVGRASNLGMLTDVGMVKGMIQTGASLGSWKEFLRKNPFDIRRAFVANNIPQQLLKDTLLGQPAQARQYRYDGAAAAHRPGAAHHLYVHTKE